MLNIHYVVPPSNNYIGNAVSIDLNMVELLLQWNIDDSVSDFERTRNNDFLMRKEI